VQGLEWIRPSNDRTSFIVKVPLGLKVFYHSFDRKMNTQLLTDCYNYNVPDRRDVDLG